MDTLAKRLLITGIVQGVGFRPFVYQLAHRFGLKGSVANTAAGVTVHVEGPGPAIDGFVRELRPASPPLARITDIRMAPAAVSGHARFIIAHSTGQERRSTLISPDAAVCADCLAELFDPADRRFGYPFINCTNCGPRYTIIDDVPYDRPKTSMRRFTMCPACQAEYDDPSNRRFHAQPNACAECGPRVRLLDHRTREVTGADPIRMTADLLRQGRIVAVKGLGGFHLAADARDESAVLRLRQRKGREEKPLAVMSRDLESVRGFAAVEDPQASLLAAVQRPIVLLEKLRPAPPLVAPSVSPGNRYFGVMLPYTPLHYLLMSLGPDPLVMTSGNISEEPICIDNDDALERLGGIADFFLVHDRDILLRADDSIVRHAAGRTRFLRRSRGYVPVPVFLRRPQARVLACGAELKSTVCLTKEDRAFVSQHIGDLENLETYGFLDRTVRHLRRILDIRPDIVACDLHPDYLSTRYADAQTDTRRIRVQHHHAHIVSCLAENRVDGPVIGLAFDGTGYGMDGCIWGGEVLVAEAARFQRVGHLAYVPMPGGAAAIREPWRMAVSYLYDAFGTGFLTLDLPFVRRLDLKKTEVLMRMMDRRVNTPMTSSLGRLFDGVAALLGLRHRVRYEGQAAMELEMTADGPAEDLYHCPWEENGGVYQIPTAPLLRGVVQDLAAGRPASGISARFHWTLIRVFTDLCRRVREDTGIHRVALSGGSFQNVILLEGLTGQLRQRGFEVFTHSRVPANDGGISLGQAVAAAAMAAA